MPATRSLLLGAALLGLVTAGCSGTSSSSRPSATPTSTASSTPPSTSPASSATRPAPARTTASRPHPSSSAPTPHPSTHSATRHVASGGGGATLPLGFSVANARQLITVTAASSGSTVGTLQRWTLSAGRWHRVGGAVSAHLGSDGLSTHPSEAQSATPIGSFTLTRAFGHDADPGTRLPYTHTTPADWWISQSGPLYNSLQHCSSGCSFTQGDPNEHLYYELPFYDYAVVIDYNTANAPGGVRQGAGSAFFLHVTDGSPTAGCVSIPQPDVVAVLRWLVPDDHPRIMIGIQ
jgi:L,D-peptidoglycan transpeptidase YkuD (ErfK/YbiS/YcfS/YnhG family)